MSSNTFSRRSILGAAVGGVAVLAAGFAIAHDGFGGGKGGHGGRMGGDPAARVERLAEKLNLTDDQKARVTEIFEARRAAREARLAEFGVTPGERPTREQRHAMRESVSGEERQATREAMLIELEDVLTPEQLEQFKAMRAERGGRHGQGGRGHHGGEGEGWRFPI